MHCRYIELVSSAFALISSISRPSIWHSEEASRKKTSRILPSVWVHNPAATNTVELSKDGLEIRYKAGTECPISTDKPLPASLDRYYYEVTLRGLAPEEQEEAPDYPFFGIGFCTFGAQHLRRPAP
jgi:hypothetical protein